MKTRTREIAKAGIFGSVENPVVVLEKDLQEIAETFPEIQKAPVQFGHWSDAAQPRLGNVVAVRYDSETKTLYGDVEEEDALAQAVDDGYYPDVSMGAKQRASDGKMYLHHLAYLGEEAPAIKDLKKDVLDKLGIVASDNSGVRMYPSSAAKKMYLSDTDKEEKMGDKEDLDKLKAENQRLEKMLSDSNAAKHAEHIAVLKKVCAGKLDEEDTNKLLALADAEAKAGTVIELSDGDGKKQVSAAQVLAEVLANVPLKVAPGVKHLSDPANQTPVEINFNAI